MAVTSSYLYNNPTKERSYYITPMKITGVPFHFWLSLVEKAGYKISDIPNTWDAFLNFFKPVQDKLRAQGMRNIYAYGYQLTANGGDPIATFNAWMIAHGGRELPAQVATFGRMIPKGAKNVAVAKEFIKYAVQPKVLNEYLKAGLGRWMLPVPELAKSDPFWLKEDPHRAAYTQQTLLGPTMPFYEVFNPASAQVNSEHLFSVAEFDVINGMAPQTAIDKAFKRVEEIFAKYPIAQG